MQAILQSGAFYSNIITMAVCCCSGGEEMVNLNNAYKLAPRQNTEDFW